MHLWNLLSRIKVSLDSWSARVKASGHAVLEEKQLKFHIERYGG